MAILTQGKLNAAFLVSEANDWRSRDEVIVDASAGALEPGAVLGRVTASGKFVALKASGSDGSQTASGVLLTGIDAKEDKRTVITRDAEVNGAELIYPSGADKAAVDKSLASAGIIVR